MMNDQKEINDKRGKRKREEKKQGREEGNETIIINKMRISGALETNVILLNRAIAKAWG